MGNFNIYITKKERVNKLKELRDVMVHLLISQT